VVPEGRAYVIDDLPRALIDNYEHRPLRELDLNGIFLLEWDLAILPEDAVRFEQICLQEPQRVRVAPYRTYTARFNRVFAHWHGDGIKRLDWIDHGASSCDGFGFGCIYLPMALLRAWGPVEDCWEKRLTDWSFSVWHIRQGLGPVPVEWSVRPVHLHWSWDRRPYSRVEVGMINDAQIGDPPAVKNDAQVIGNEPLPGAEEIPPQEAPEVEDEEAVEESSEEGQETVEEKADDDDAESQGRAAAEAGEERSNPYDGRTAKGKAWYRGYDSV
jgi:hypothetical protein